MRSALILAGAMIFNGTASAQEVAPAEPTSRWIVDFGEKQCTAARAFETGLGNTTILLGPGLLDDTIEFWMVFEGGPPKKDWGDLSARVGAAQPAQDVRYLHVELEGGGHAVRFGLDRHKHFSDNPSQIQVQTEKGPPIALAFGAFDPVAKVLDDCNEGLRIESGMEPGALDKIAKRAEGHVLNAFSSEDYPSEALRKGEEGAAVVLYSVNEKGRVNECEIWESSGSHLLDKKTCQVIKSRARFKPALDADGNPTVQPMSTTVRWIIP